jgi:hypothetical protein
MSCSARYRTTSSKRQFLSLKEEVCTLNLIEGFAPYM